jgi:dipeptidyl aminopeptidase/acylaminoacyl peptidase
MRTQNKDWRKRWMVLLGVGLLIEMCILSIVLLVWMIQRNMTTDTVMAALQPSQAALSPSDPTDQSTPVLPVEAPTQVFQPGVTLPPSLQPTELLQASPTAGLPQFDVAPPGKIVFTCFDGQFDQICLMNADGSQRRQLTDIQATNFYPSLSADGETIVFSSRRDGNFDIYLMDINGGNLQQLTDRIGNCYAPEISPKGNRIIFTNESGGVQSIWVMRIDGSNARPLVQTSEGAIDPTWSPDAQQIAFASNAGGRTQIWTVNADGSKPSPLLQDNLETGGRSSWSPDGMWIAFYAGPQANHNLYMVGYNGGSLQQLTNGGDNLAPSFSPDGAWLTFTSYRDGNNEIYVLRLADMRVWRITNNSLSDWQPRWGN